MFSSVDCAMPSRSGFVDGSPNLRAGDPILNQAVILLECLERDFSQIAELAISKKMQGGL
jgi:hypothetical protein